MCIQAACALFSLRIMYIYLNIQYIYHSVYCLLVNSIYSINLQTLKVESVFFFTGPLVLCTTGCKPQQKTPRWKRKSWLQFILVVEPTHSNNMLVNFHHFPNFRGEQKNCLKLNHLVILGFQNYYISVLTLRRCTPPGIRNCCEKRSEKQTWNSLKLKKLRVFFRKSIDVELQQWCFFKWKCKKIHSIHPFKSSMQAATYLGAPCVLSHGTSLKLLQETQRSKRELDGREWNHLYVVHDGQRVIISCLMKNNHVRRNCQNIFRNHEVLACT